MGGEHQNAAADVAEGAPPLRGVALLCGVLCCILCVAYIDFFGPPINPGDLVLAFPIAKELADPGLYADQDLIVSSGQRMPFHVYRLASVLYAQGLDVEAIWFVLYQLFLFATFFGVWTLAYTYSGRTAVATASAACLASMSFLRGALHWSTVPLTSLITAQVALPFALAAMVFLWRGRGMASLLLAGLTFNLHPYIGLMTIAGISACVLFVLTGTPLRRRLLWLCLGAAVALPNAVYILLSLPGNFASTADAPSNQAFFEQFRIYAWHAFVEDHWLQGYGWFALQLAGAVFFTRYMAPLHRRLVWGFTLTMLVLMAAYLANLYGPRFRMLNLMFLMRASYLVKPIMLAVVVSGSLAWMREDAPSRAARVGIGAGIGLMLFTRSMRAAEPIGLITYCALLWLAAPRSDRTARFAAFAHGAVGVFLLAVYLVSHVWRLLSPSASWENLSVAIVIASSVHLAYAFHRLAHPGRAPWRPARGTPALPVALRTTLAALLGVLLVRHAVAATTGGGLASLTPRSARVLSYHIRFSDPAEILAPMMAWVRDRTPRGSLFMVPPNQPLLFAFRYQAERGILGTRHDVNQLAFDTAVYREAHRRLTAQGMQVVGRHRFDDRAYHMLPVARLLELRERYGVDYALFFSRAVGEPMQGEHPAYDDGTFTIYDLSVLSSP